MLSILIPVYNFDIRHLVIELQKQALMEKVPFEIVVLDDVSDSRFRLLNREIANLRHVVYTELPQNIGRSKIRNRLSLSAKYDYLLFMDSDADVQSKTFIADYVKECKGEVVVCGGMGYASSYKEYSQKNDFDLRLKYGKRRECKTAEERNIVPNNSFMTFNFLISKSILQKVSFDESLTHYGHEDTVFGLELKHHNIVIKHIDNPLYHLELDSNSEFITKALSSVVNLFSILNRGYYYNDLKQDVKLLRYYTKLKLFGLTPLVGIIYRLMHKSIERNLIERGQNLFYFDMLRLGFLCTMK